jgi:hypothetical protein
MVNRFLVVGDRFLVWYEKWLIKPAQIVLNSLMTLFILYSVFMRYVLNRAPTWSEELTRYIMVWAALLGMGNCLPVQQAYRAFRSGGKTLGEMDKCGAYPGGHPVRPFLAARMRYGDLHDPDGSPSEIPQHESSHVDCLPCCSCGKCLCGS